MFSQEETYQNLVEQGEYQEALDLLQQNIEDRPDLVEIGAYRYIVWLSDRAEILRKTGDIDGAIRDMEIVAAEYNEPVFLLRLIELYKERGRIDDYRATLERAASQQRIRFFHSRERNYVAAGRLAELSGENPKQLLSTLYTSLMENRPGFIGGFIAAGDLAFRHYSYDMAERYFKDALELEEDNEEALGGLALTYWKAGDPRLAEVMKALVEAHPNSETALRIRIEQHLDLGEADEAIELIETALAVNPNHQLMRSLKAAALFLNDELDAMNELQQSTLELNPACSQAFHVPGRIASRHYRFKEGVEFQRRALEIDPDDKDARAQYGLDLLRLGNDEEGKKQLESAFEEDPYNVQSYNLLQMLDSLDAFTQSRSDSFVLQTPKDEQIILESEMLGLLHEAFDHYEEKYQVELETPVQIQVFDNHDDFMVRSVGLPGNTGFMGICFGGLVTMDSPSAREPRSMNWASVLWHEFVHVATLQKTNNRMPRWLSEGISVYEETQRDSAWGQKMDIQYKPILDEEGLPGVADLETYFVNPKTGMHIMLGYFLGGEFVEFYVDEYGFDSLLAALDRMGEGDDALQTLVEESGVSNGSMDRSFEAFLTERLKPYDNLPSAPDEPNWLEEMWSPKSRSAETLGPWIERDSPFTNTLREAKTALDEGEIERAEELFIKAHELFPDYTGQGAPLYELARIYDETNEFEKLKETIERIVGWDATGYDSRKKLIELRQYEADWEGMLAAARLVIEIDPFDPDAREHELDALKRLERFDDAVVVVDKLAALRPQDRVDYALQRIDLLQKARRLTDAKRDVIELLEEFPHHRLAQQRLLAIVEDGGIAAP